MKADIRYIALLILFLTIILDAKVSSKTIKKSTNRYAKQTKKVRLKPVDLIKPVSLPAHENIDYRDFFFAKLTNSNQ